MPPSMYSSRNIVPNMVFAVSFIWQQKKPNSVTMNAGTRSGQLPQSSSISGRNAGIFIIASMHVIGECLV